MPSERVVRIPFVGTLAARLPAAASRTASISAGTENGFWRNAGT